MSLHVQDWISIRQMSSNHKSEDEKMAMAFLLIKGLSALDNMVCEPLIKDIKLFCSYKGDTYRVTGCSQLGDVWLNTNLDADIGYTDRVSVVDCSDWSTSKENR